MNYLTVQRLADAAGVSVRTLHHYDRIGLLVPSERSESGYRLYGEKDLAKLQHILFYRELDVPLKEIRCILDAPDFDRISALHKHARELEHRRDRLNVLLQTIQQTLLSLENNTMPTPEDLYQGFGPQAEAIRQEAVVRYGKEAVQRSEGALKKLSKEHLQALVAKQKELRNTLFKLKDANPHSQAVQDLIREHYDVTRAFWGTSTETDPQADQYAGLGQLYVDDPRFMTWDGESHAEFAVFMREAMKVFSKTLAF